MKIKFWKKEEEKRPWPTREVDYEGNQMWENSFPKPAKRTWDDYNYYAAQQNIRDYRGISNLYNPYQCNSLLGGLLKPFGI